jgi:hypothetical protein
MRETSSNVIPRLQPCGRELQRRRAQQAHKGSSGRTFFSKFTSSEQSYAAALRQDTQHQQPQAPQTYEKSFLLPVQQHLPQQEIQIIGLSVQAPSSTNNDTSKITTVLQQIITELSEAVSEKDTSHRTDRFSGRKRIPHNHVDLSHMWHTYADQGEAYS